MTMQYFYRHSASDVPDGLFEKAALLQLHAAGYLPDTVLVASSLAGSWVPLSALITWDGLAIKPSNVEPLGIASLVIGVLTAPFVPFMGAAMAIGVGHSALRKLRVFPWRKGRMVSRAGLSIGYLCLACYLILMIFMFTHPGVSGSSGRHHHHWGEQFYRMIPS